MNLKKLIIFFIVVAIAYVFNYKYLGLSIWTFTGILLLVWLFGGFLFILIIKFYKKKRGIKQSDDSYVFPDIMSSMMKKVDMRTQYEASLLSISFILIGLIFMAIYTVTFTEISGWAKFMISFNMFWGFIFLLSFLVTTYQQYVSYLETTKILEGVGDSPELSDELIPTSQAIIQAAQPSKEAAETPNLYKMKGGQKKHG